MRISARQRKLLLTVHVLVTVAVIGGALVLAVLGQAGLRGADPHTIYPAARLVEIFVIAPLVVAALVTGIAQAIVGGWGLLRYWWVAIKLTVTTALTLAVFLVLLPGLSDAAAKPDQVTASERAAIAMAPIAATVLGVLNAVLGMYKPRWRLRAAPITEHSAATQP